MNNIHIDSTGQYSITMRRFHLSLFHSNQATAYIGDVHGRIGTFRAIVETIDRLNSSCRYVLLGDLVDRGEDSLACLKLGIELRRRSPRNKYLIGNHEQMMMGAMLDRTIDEYGSNHFLNGGNWLTDFVSPSEELTGPSLRNALSQKLGEDPLLALCNDSPEILNCLVRGEKTPELVYDVDGTILAVHAGVNCETKNVIGRLNDRSTILPTENSALFQMTAMWTRRPFLLQTTQDSERFPYLIVHGHTPEHRTAEYSRGPVLNKGDIRRRGCRLGLDGGAASGKRVAAAIITENEVVTLYAAET